MHTLDIVWFRCGFLHIDFFAGNCLFWCFQKLINYLFRIECDETECLALVLLFIEWHFNFNDLFEFLEIPMTNFNEIYADKFMLGKIFEFQLQTYRSKLAEEDFDFLVADFGR